MSEPEVNLKREVPEEQSFTVFAERTAVRRESIVMMRVNILELLKDIIQYVIRMEVYVFRKDMWRQILLPVDIESWTQEERQLYGSLVVNYEEKGFSKKKAEQLAEAFVYQEKYSGLRYSGELDRILGK